jgi:hypothetical protein
MDPPGETAIEKSGCASHGTSQEEAARSEHAHVQGYSKSLAFIRVGPPGYFTHITITTPIVSALKNYYRWGFLEVPTDILNHFWIQVTSETAVTRPFRK